MFEQDETGWGSDLGFPKKVMVLAPSDEEDDVYYRANVLEVDRKRKLVTLEYTESQGYGRHKTFTLPLDHKRIWRCTCDANRWEKLFADARQRQRRCKHSGGWRPKPGAERIAYSELPVHEQAKAATKEAGAARDTSKHERRRQRQHQRKQRKHQRPQHGNSGNSLRQKLVRLASLIGSACGIQPSSSRYTAAADPSTTGKEGSRGSDLCSQDSSSDNNGSEDSTSSSSGSSVEASESDSSSSSDDGAAGEGSVQPDVAGELVPLHPHSVGGGNAFAAGQAETAAAVAAGSGSGSAEQAPAAGSRSAAATQTAAATTTVAGALEPPTAAPAAGVGGRKRRAAADGVTAASLAAAFNAGKSGSAKRVRITASSAEAETAAAAAPAIPDIAHPVGRGLLPRFSRQQQQHSQQCADKPATAAVAAANGSVSSIMIDGFQLHILSVQHSRGACQLYIAQCQLTQYAIKCLGVSRETMREATQAAFVRKGRVVATAAQVELLNQAGAAMHCNARYLLKLDVAAHICDRRDMHSAAAALRAARLNMAAAAAAAGGPVAVAATANTQQQQCQRDSVEQQRAVEASGRTSLRSIVIDGFTLHLLPDQHRDSSCIYYVAASQLSRYAQQCCGLHRKAIYDTRRTLKARTSVCTDAQQQLLLNAKAVQHTRRHGNAHLLSLPLAVDVCQKCGLLTAAEALEALLQQPAAVAALSHDAAAVSIRADEAGDERQPQPPADQQTDSMRLDIQHQQAARKPSNTACQPDLLTALAAAVAVAKAAVVTPDRPASSAAVPPAAQEAALRPVRIDGYQLHLLPVSSGSGSPEYFIAQPQLVKLIRQVTGLMYSVDSEVDKACQEAESAVILASIHQQQLLLSYGVLEEFCECRLLPLDSAASVLAHFDMDDASESLLAVVGQQGVVQGVDQDVDQGVDHGVIQAAEQSLDPAGDQGDNQSSDQSAEQGGEPSLHRASGRGVVQGVDQASDQKVVDQVVDEASHQVVDRVVDQFVSQGVGQSVVVCVDQGGDQGAVPGVTVGTADSPAVSGLGQQQNQQQRQTSLQQRRQQQEEEEESEPCDHSRQQKQLLEPPAVSQQTGPSGQPDAASAAAAAAALQRPAVLPVQMTSSTVLQQQLQHSGLNASKDSNQPGLQPAQQQQQQQLSSSASKDQLQQKVAIAVAPASIKQAAGYRGAAVHSEPPASAAPASVPRSLEGPQVMDSEEPSGPQQVEISGAGALCSAQAAAGDRQQCTAEAAAASAEATPRAATFAPVAAAGPTQPVTTADMDNQPPSSPSPTPPATAAPVVPAAALNIIQLPGSVELCVLRAADNTAWLLYEHFQRYAVNSPDTLIRTRHEFDGMFTEIAQYSKHTVRTRRAEAAEQRLLAASGKLAAGSRSTKLVLLEVAAATFEQLTLLEAAVALLTAPAQAAPAPAPAPSPSMLGPTSLRAVSPALVLDSQSADSQVAGQAPPAAVSRSQPRQMQGGTAFPSSSPQQEVVQQPQHTPAQQTAISLARVALDMPQQGPNRQEQHREQAATHEADVAPGLSLSQSVELSHALQRWAQEHQQQLQEEAQKQQQQQEQQEDEAVDLTKADASFKAARDVGIRTRSRLSSPRRPLAALQVDLESNVLAAAGAEANDCIDLTADD